MNSNQTCFNQCGACIWFGGLELLVLVSIPISENWIEISLIIFGSILELELELNYVNKCLKKKVELAANWQLTIGSNFG